MAEQLPNDESEKKSKFRENLEKKAAMEKKYFEKPVQILNTAGSYAITGAVTIFAPEALPIVKAAMPVWKASNELQLTPATTLLKFDNFIKGKSKNPEATKRKFQETYDTAYKLGTEIKKQSTKGKVILMPVQEEEKEKAA